MKKTFLCFIFGLSIALWRCGDDEGENGEGKGSPSYPAKARFQSTSLTLLEKAALASESCPEGSSCLTPSEVGGVVMAVGFSAGVLGEQQGYFINPIGPTDPSSADGGSGTEEFTLSKNTELSGEYVCCGGTSYPEGDNVVARNFQIYFDYIDTTFNISSGTLKGDHTIRIMYTDKTFSDGMVTQKGDKLYKDGDTFYFCDGSACDQSVRSETSLQEKVVSQRSGANPNYAFFQANVIEPFSFTKAEAKTGNWIFSLDFNVTNGAVFSSDPLTATSIYDLVASFSINSTPGDGNDGRTGFQVSAQKSSF